MIDGGKRILERGKDWDSLRSRWKEVRREDEEKKEEQKRLRPICASRWSRICEWTILRNEWVTEWMKDWMKIHVMMWERKRGDRHLGKKTIIGRFVRFKRLRDGQTNWPTNRRTDMISHRCVRTPIKRGENDIYWVECRKWMLLTGCAKTDGAVI